MLSNNSRRDIQPQQPSKAGEAFGKMHDEQRRNLIRLLRQTPAVVEAIRKSRVSSDEAYRVVIPPDMTQQLKAGTARLGEGTASGFTANIHNNKTGEIISQIRLEKVSPELIASLNQMAMQSALLEIAQRLELIEQKIEEVLQGQRDDRAGLLDSGENLYALASAATDPENRRLLLANAVAQVSEARGRLIRALETRLKSIDEIPGDKWGIILKSIRQNIAKDVERKAELLERALREVLRASCILALSYGQLGEPALLQESWQPLENFLPKIRAAQEKIIRWLPPRPYALPDRFSTLLSATDSIVQTGKRLESGQTKALEIEFSSSEMLEGET